MKGIILTAALVCFTSASWAKGDWNCGSVKGKNIDVSVEPALFIDGNEKVALIEYSSDDSTFFYTTADGKYIWGGSSKATAIYDGNRKFLANCKRPKSKKGGWFKRIFPDNGYGGDRGNEFP